MLILAMLLGTLAAEPEPLDLDAAAEVLRAELEAAYVAEDFEAMSRYLHPEVYIVFPDATVLEGVDELAAYHARMMTGDDAIVIEYEANPEVDRRYTSRDAIVSQGRMNDVYTLADGTVLALDSRFTATLTRVPDGPAETGGFVIRSFHSSTSAFDNPALRMVAGRAALYAGLAAGVLMLIVGALLGWLIGRRRAAAAK